MARLSTTSYALGSWLSSFVVAAGFGAGCTSDDASGPLEVTQLDDTTIAGSLVTDKSVISFESVSDDQRSVALQLDINGSAMRFTYDVRGTLTEDGGMTVLRADDLTALLELRDAINREHPELVQSSLQGMFLSRHADWLADAPNGYTVDTRIVESRNKVAKDGITKTTDDDNEFSTCLVPGLTYRAWYDEGGTGQRWMWDRVAGSGSCVGRCGSGCNFFDTDLMLDCFEHDSCVDHLGGSGLGDNPNCGDEFRHAAKEYVVTLGDWCPFGI